MGVERGKERERMCIFTGYVVPSKRFKKEKKMEGCVFATKT